MKELFRFNTRSLILLTIAVAMLSAVGLHRYSQYREVRRQEILRLEFQQLAESFNLEVEIKRQIIQDPDVARELQNETEKVLQEDGSDIAGSWKSSKQLGPNVLVPGFVYQYEYYWLREQEEWEQKPFRLSIRSALHPSTMTKPLIRFQTQGTELESRVVDRIINRLDQTKVDVVREKLVSGR